MSKIVLERREVVLGVMAMGVIVLLALGFGYFFGRYDWLQSQHASLKTIPDVNCSS